MDIANNCSPLPVLRLRCLHATYQCPIYIHLHVYTVSIRRLMTHHSAPCMINFQGHAT